MSGKTYKTKIKQNYDVKGGYFYYIELPDELIQELGWNEDLKLDVVVKLGEKKQRDADHQSLTFSPVCDKMFP